ncbi:hypothetical protein RUND412_008097 [Rhizina undulata]
MSMPVDLTTSSIPPLHNQYARRPPPVRPSSTTLSSFGLSSNQPGQPLDTIPLPRAPSPPPTNVPSVSKSFTNCPRIFIIGAGSRGTAYARAIPKSTRGVIVGIAEPSEYKRKKFCRNYGLDEEKGLVFGDWRDMVKEKERILRAGIDGVVICTLDDTHAEIIKAIRPMNIHIFCEKPLATTLADCVDIYNAVTSTADGLKPILFAIGHVLRYSPHNILLRKLVCEDGIIGEVVSVNHTEPVGWWHFAHSYVRGNWRNTSTSAPSLLTKCCHDLDILLWLLSSPYTPSSTFDQPNASGRKTPHLPTTVSSSGSLVHFKKSRKPRAAGSATNCLSCPAEPDCQFSAKRIYIDLNLRGAMNTGWPVKIIVPEIEDADSLGDAEAMLLGKLAEEPPEQSQMAITQGGESGDGNDEVKSYYGRCVYEAGNDVVDNQVVTIAWEDDFGGEEESDGWDAEKMAGRGAKTATLTMIAHTKKICERYTRIYGTKGELEADSNVIRVTDFATHKTHTFTPTVTEDDLLSGHGGGDYGLVKAFVEALDAVKNGEDSVAKVQTEYIKCEVDEILRSHAIVFAAEEARTQKKTVEWEAWWKEKVVRKEGKSGLDGEVEVRE